MTTPGFNFSCLFYFVVYLFDHFYVVDLVVVHLVLCQPKFIVLLFFLPALILIFSVLAKRLAENSDSNMTDLVSSGTLNF